MTPEYRFTFFNDVLAPTGMVVAQPLGWKEASISLTRDPNYHSLVEYFKGSFIWYGSARDFIRSVEDTQGPDAKIGITIELKFSADFQEIFRGTVDVSQIEDISLMKKFYKSVVPVIQDDFWVKFLNRSAIPVDLEGASDLNGNARTVVNKTVLPMPSQAMQKELDISTISYVFGNALAATVTSGKIHYLGLGFETIRQSEIQQLFTLSSQLIEHDNPYGMNGLSPFGTDLYSIDNRLYTLKVNENAEGTFNLVVNYTLVASRSGGLGTHDVGARFGIAVRHTDESIDFYECSNSYFTSGRVTTDVNGNATFSKSHELHQALSLVQGDEIYIYGELMIASAFANVHNISLDYQDNGETFVSFSASTTLTDSEADVYLVKDAAKSILSKIIGQDDVLVSDQLDACVGNNVMTRGKHIRGYTFSEKAFAMSFQEWWQSMEPLYNLGLGYVTVAGVKKIRIEKKEYFYNPTPVVFLSHVTDLVRTYDLEKIYKSLEIGSEQWSAESSSGVDDPQTRHIYDMGLKTIGADLKILSKAILASLAIEQTRRNRKELGKDWRLDENLFVMSVLDDSGWRLEVGSDFDAVTNLLNSDGRINIRHTPGYMLQRWLKWIAGGHQIPGGTSLRFRKGEGNYVTTSTLASGQCEYGDIAGTVDEAADVALGSNVIFLPKVYRAKVPMSRATYDQILANKERAIGISTTNQDYLAMHIMDMDYKIIKGHATLDLLLANSTPINP